MLDHCLWQDREPYEDQADHCRASGFGDVEGEQVHLFGGEGGGETRGTDECGAQRGLIADYGSEERFGVLGTELREEWVHSREYGWDHLRIRRDLISC